MNKKISAALAFVFVIATVLIAVNSTAAPPTELQDLRKSFTAEWKGASDDEKRQELLNNYIKDLTSLVYYMRGNGHDRASINAVRGEIRKANNALLGEGEIIGEEPEPEAAEAEPATVAPPSAGTEPAASPVPAQEQAAKKRSPQTHVMTTRGLAGAPEFSKNNIYTFTLASVGPRSTLAYWATGRRSTDSFGEIWLTTPDRRRHRIAKWKRGYFRKPSTDISSYYQLKPITEDITKYVNSPGAYSVEFHWTDGIDPLVIFRVEITS